MIRRFAQFLNDNKFGFALWIGIALLIVSSQRRTATEGTIFGQQGGKGEQSCDFATVLGQLIGVVECDDIAAPPDSGETSGIRFERNVGQADSGYGFIAHGHQQSILLSAAESVIELRGSKKTKARFIHASFAGGRSNVEPQAEQPLSGRVNYLIGDSKKWHTDIPTFGAVRFPNVYPGVDVVYHGNRGNLETDFVVQPGGDPESIRIKVGGADQVQLESDGSLSARADKRTLSWKKPTLYQVGAHGQKSRVEGRFRFESNGSVGFEVGAYDIHRPLVIDPVLTYATYFGTPYGEGAARVAADASGNAYIVGSSDDPSFPSSPGSFFSLVDGIQGNMLVAKLGPDGKSMVYETHIGGSNGDLGWGIALDSTGNVYLTGATDSSDFPLLPAANNLTTKSVTDPLNCFVTKLNPAGNALIYSVVIGGTNADGCSSVGIDSSGNAYVVGVTTSSDFPTVSPVQPNFPGVPTSTGSAFVAKVSPDGTKLLYSTYFGGSGGNAAATAIAVDGAGNAYFTGFSFSSALPVSANAFQPTYGGNGGQTYSSLTSGDAFVVKMSPTGQKIYATYLGGSKDDIGLGIAIDAQGDAYIGGATLSTNFPTKNPFQSAYKGAGGDQYSFGGDGFITELDPTGSTLLFSSYIGGSKDDRVLGVALDSSGNIYLAGHTLSPDFPTAEGAQAQSAYVGDTGGVWRHQVMRSLRRSARLTPRSLSPLISADRPATGASGIAVDGTGGIIIAGGTTSTDFPVSSSVYQAKYAGSDPYWKGYPVGDAFIARFGGTISSVNITGVSNAASYVGGSIAPGEAILIAGSGIGPASIAGAALTANGNLSTQISGTQFLFNGVPAPIVYVSAQYSSVIVPYEVATASTAQIVAMVNGAASPPFTVPVAASLPGVFSANASGSGQAAVLNQDLSHNSAQNPAVRGSFVVVYVTGEGQTVPPGVTGSVTASKITPVLPVTVNFGNVPATSYPFVGETPGVVAGVMQINVTVPQNAPTGVVPITVMVGSVVSQSGLTVAIQ